MALYEGCRRAGLDDAAARLGATPAQVALAWQAAKPGITASIASATSEAQLAELVKAASMELDREAIEALRMHAAAPRY